MAAIALLLLFAWQGYRRGALGWIAAIGSSLLALAAAFLFALALAQAVAGHSAWEQIIGERIAFFVLLIVFRFVFGWVMHELVGSLRSILWALPPLGLIDRLLGVIPSVALGLILLIVVLFAAICCRSTAAFIMLRPGHTPDRSPSPKSRGQPRLSHAADC